MARFDSILGTVGNTPVVRINRLAPAHVNLFVKIEAFNPLGSVKDRLALGVIEAAEKSGELKPGQTVIEATSGNTGIGLAMVCAAKGYPLVVTMAETFSVERRKLMRFLGAKVILTPAADRGLGMVEKARELAAKHGWFLTRQFENEANADIHSRTTAREIIADFRREARLLGDRLGTGGTLKGVARVLAKERPETKIVVCEPDDAPMLTSGTEQERNPDGSPAAPRRVQAASDAGLEPGFHPQADRRCGRHEGDRPDPHDPGARRDEVQPGTRAEGRHLRRHHLRRHVRGRAAGRGGAPKGSNILCMLPDTGERYLSTPLFADMPADMTEEEQEISRSTPGFHMPPRRGLTVAQPRSTRIGTSRRGQCCNSSGALFETPICSTPGRFRSHGVTVRASPACSRGMEGGSKPIPPLF